MYFQKAELLPANYNEINLGESGAEERKNEGSTKQRELPPPSNFFRTFTADIVTSQKQNAEGARGRLGKEWRRKQGSKIRRDGKGDLFASLSTHGSQPLVNLP